MHGNTFSLPLSTIPDCASILLADSGRFKSRISFQAILEHNPRFPQHDYQVSLSVDKNHSQLVRDQVKEGCEAHQKALKDKKDQEEALKKEAEELQKA